MTKTTKKFILARKLGMTQIFDEDGKVHPVTFLEAGPVIVTQKKTRQREGYNVMQLGFGKKKNIPKPLRGHLKGLTPEKGGGFRYLREWRVESEKDLLDRGSKIDISIFEKGERVSVSALSKGRGFQGVIKRHGFRGGPKSHGQKHHFRAPGSIGSTAFQRVVPGRKMPGHMGMKRVTIKNLKVIEVLPENNILALEGAVPGSRGTLVEVYK
jgi:large subunit ribosomal protein L3